MHLQHTVDSPRSPKYQNMRSIDSCLRFFMTPLIAVQGVLIMTDHFTFVNKMCFSPEWFEDLLNGGYIDCVCVFFFKFIFLIAVVKENKLSWLIEMSHSKFESCLKCITT